MSPFTYILQPSPESTAIPMGTGLRSGKRAKSAYFPPAALHYLCPQCGHLWLRIIPADATPCRHNARAMPCPSCGPGWGNFTAKELAELPLPMLQREVELAAKAPRAWHAFYRGKLSLLEETQND